MAVVVVKILGVQFYFFSLPFSVFSSYLLLQLRVAVFRLRESEFLFFHVIIIVGKSVVQVESFVRNDGAVFVEVSSDSQLRQTISKIFETMIDFEVAYVGAILKSKNLQLLLELLGLFLRLLPFWEAVICVRIRV